MTVLSTGSGAPLNDCSEPRGRGQDVAGSDLTAGAGGSAGFTTGTAWDAVAGQSEFMTDLNEYLAAMEESPELRSAALLQAMTRLRDALDQIPEDTDLEAPVSLSVRDAVLIARRLLTPLR